MGTIGIDTSMSYPTKGLVEQSIVVELEFVPLSSFSRFSCPSPREMSHILTVSARCVHNLNFNNNSL